MPSLTARCEEDKLTKLWMNFSLSLGDKKQLMT